MLSNSQLLQPDQPAVQLPPPPGLSPFVCPFCIEVVVCTTAARFRNNLKTKHSDDSATRIRHHNFPSCATVSCCRFCSQTFRSVKGRTMHERRMHGEQHSRQLAKDENQAPNSEETTVDETTDTTSTPLQHPLLTNPAIVHHPTQQPVSSGLYD